MKKSYIVFLALFLLYLISSNHISGEVNSNYIKVLNNHLNVREGPGMHFNVIDQVHKNEKFPFIEEMDEWVKIKLDDQEGWVSSEFVEKIIEDEVNSTIEDAFDLIIPKDQIHIREKPVSDSEIIYFAKKGERLTILEELDKWLKVELKDGVGYVYKNFIYSKSLIKGNIFENKIIVIDPGHGGYDVGAISVSGEYEKDYSLTTSKLLQETLEALGVTVIMTREVDDYVRLGSRVSLSNLINPDAFLSLHYNSFPEAPSAKGISTFYYDKKDQDLAESIQKHLLISTGAQDRNALYENLQVLRHNQSRAILIELGFISNIEEENLLKTSQYQNLLVEGIVKGLYEYFSINK